jgi:hypothetical protein
MKRFALTASIVAALAWPGLLLAAGSLPGTYTGTVTRMPPVSGMWRLTFTGAPKSHGHSKSGSFAFTLHGKAVEHGVYSISGDNIPFNDDTETGCNEAGDVYYWHLAGRKLIFAPISSPP